MASKADISLRKAVFEDWEAMYKNVWSKPETAKYMLWKVTESSDEAKIRIEKTIAYQENNYGWLVCLDDMPIGFAGFKMTDEHTAEDSGIAIGLGYAGHGYGRQVVHLLLDMAKEAGADTFIYTTRAENLASVSLAEKCGFALTGSEQKTDPRDDSAYEMLIYTKNLL
ncbi:MAG: GNAT family N-acetyltransferase [Clostridia bacterium]|nr:GNAT family N-acetyltransferase [Clostridia bacterium]